jgi:hypothetical protein
MRDKNMSDAYTQKWIMLVPNRVCLSIGAGHLSAADLQTFDWEFTSMIDASTAPLVHLIADSRHVLSLPSLVEMRKNRYPYHPRMGHSLTIGAHHSPVMRFILSVSSSISKVRYKDVPTLAEACTYLAHKDPSLPPIHTWALPVEADMTKA